MSLISIIGALVMLAVLGMFCGSAETSSSQEDVEDRNDDWLIEEISSDQNDRYWDPPGDNV